MSPPALLPGTQPLIVQLLLDKGILDAAKLEALREAQARDNGPLEAILVRKGLTADRDIAEAYAEYLVLPLFEPAPGATPVDPGLGRLLPEKLCRDQLIAPVAVHGESLELIFA